MYRYPSGASLRQAVSQDVPEGSRKRILRRALVASLHSRGICCTLELWLKLWLLNAIACRFGKSGFWVGQIRFESLNYPICFRYGSSDVLLIKIFFLLDAYRPLELPRNNVRSIIDCGANIGCTAAYFLSRYPQATVIAVEPDPDNVVLLRQNMAHYGDRVVVISAAIWHREARLKLIRGGRGHEWESQVVNAGGDGEVAGMSIDQIMDMQNIHELDILKMNVEGAEAVVFTGRVSRWINRVKSFVIDLHGKQAVVEFEQILEGRRFVCRQSGKTFYVSHESP